MSLSSPTPTATNQEFGLFHPVPLATLRPGLDAPFELYAVVAVRGGQKYILFKGADVEFTERHRRELLERGTKTLYVKASDAGEYCAYVDRTVGQVLASDRVSAKDKSRILYETSGALVRSVFDRPDSPALVAANQTVATHTVTALAAEPALFRTLVSLFTTDYSLYSHSVHVSVLATGLVLETGERSSEEAREAAIGFLLHDIGKRRLPLEVLQKPAMLSPWQIREMEKHPRYGVELLQHHEGIQPRALDIIHNHHERLNGSGYPRGLSGDGITLEARICSVVDVFDALTSHRVYKPALRGFDALQLMVRTMSHELDSAILQLLIGRLGPAATRTVE